MDDANALLSLMEANASTRWVAEQVRLTLAQGVSMSAKDAAVDASFSLVAPTGLTAPERRKRERYETTRQYSAHEKLELVRAALRALYVELPAIAVASFESLSKIGAHVSKIEFVPPDEAGEVSEPYVIEPQASTARQNQLREGFKAFESELLK